MSDFKKIMVAVAFSPYTEGIFKYAARLASSLDADLVIANIINKRDVKAIMRLVQQGYEVDSDDYVRGMTEERQLILNQLLQNTGVSNSKDHKLQITQNPIQI